MSGKRQLHGSHSYYVHQKCRCERCKMARRDYMRGYRAKRKAALEEVAKAAFPIGETEDRSSVDV